MVEARVEPETLWFVGKCAVYTTISRHIYTYAKKSMLK